MKKTYQAQKIVCRKQSYRKYLMLIKRKETFVLVAIKTEGSFQFCIKKDGNSLKWHATLLLFPPSGRDESASFY